MWRGILIPPPLMPGGGRAALTIARALNETESEFIARLQIVGDEEYGEEG